MATKQSGMQPDRGVARFRAPRPTEVVVASSPHSPWSHLAMQSLGPPASLYAAVIAAVFAFGVGNAYVTTARGAAHQEATSDLAMTLTLEAANVVVIALLLPLLFAAVRRVRTATGWSAHILIGVAAILTISGLYIAGTVLLRALITALAGGPDDFGLSLASVIAKVSTCILIGAAFLLFQSRKVKTAVPAITPEPAPTEAPPAPPQASPTLWLREGTTRIRVEPKDVVWVASAGDSVEFALQDGMTHLIHGTLASAEARLKPLNFVRVHRTRLVNMAWVKELKPGADGDFEIVLRNGQTVGGSRRYRHSLAALDGFADARPAPPS